MIVFPISPIKPVAKVVRSDKSEKTEEPEAPQSERRLQPVQGRSPRREGKAFYKSPNERSSSAVQDALLDLPRSR